MSQVSDDNNTIIVKDGGYSACVFINRRFVSSLLLEAEHPYQARWQRNNSSSVLKIGGDKNVVIEGCEFTRPDLSANHRWLVVVWLSGDTWVENITLRDNILHDSVHDDLMLIGTGARNIVVEGNAFYNQASVHGEYIDVNGAVDTTVQDNIFFNDAAGHKADPTNIPADDILGNNRGDIDAAPDIDDYEYAGFRLTFVPIFQHIDPGESASYRLNVEPVDATKSVSLSTGSVPSDIILNLEPTTVSVSGVATLTVTSTHASLSLIPDVWVHVPITATGGGFTRTTAVHLLVGGFRRYLHIF